MGNTLDYPNDRHYNDGVNECFCSICRAIDEHDWDKFVAHARSTQHPYVLTIADEHGRSLLHHAAMQEDPRYVEAILLKLKCLTEECDSRPYLEPDCHLNTPLHLALGHGNWEGARLLVKCFPDHKYCPNRLGNTPLHIAVLRDHFECVKHLCELFPEDLEVKNKDGKTPADLCQSREVCSYLSSMDDSECTNILAIVSVEKEVDESTKRFPVVPLTSARRPPTGASPRVTRSRTVASVPSLRRPVPPPSSLRRPVPPPSSLRTVPIPPPPSSPRVPPVPVALSSGAPRLPTVPSIRTRPRFSSA